MSDTLSAPNCYGDFPINPVDYAERDCMRCPFEPGCKTSSKNSTNPSKSPINPLDVQVAGGHYKGKKIQPVEYISANKLNFLEGCIVKRITRWRDKPAEHRFQDLEKIKHEVDLLIEMEKRHG
jgi:hypothetical protein